MKRVTYAGLLVLLLHAGACQDIEPGPGVDAGVGSADDPGEEMPESPPEEGDPEDVDIDVDDLDADGVGNDSDNCAEAANPEQADRDSDGFGDACDCDADDPAIAAEIVFDGDPGADPSLLTASSGAPLDSWDFGGGLAQTRLADNARDAIHFNNLQIENLRVVATVASTAVASFGTTDWRQVLLVARGRSDGDSYQGLGCGLEVLESQYPIHNRTSAMALQGSMQALSIQAGSRVERPAIASGEDVTLTLDLRGDVMTCQAEIRGATTTAAGRVPQRSGWVGFHTRESKAIFRDVRICRYPDDAAAQMPIVATPSLTVQADPCLFLRSGASTDAPPVSCDEAGPTCVLGSICYSSGASLPITGLARLGSGCNSRWFPTVHDGETGWVCGDFLVP